MASGWAYIGYPASITASGPTGSIQYHGRGTSITGSSNFVFYSASVSNYAPQTVVLSGTLLVSGTISASAYHIKDITNIHSSGSSKFGDSLDDKHEFSGSINLTSSYASWLMGSNLGLGTKAAEALLHIHKAATTDASVLEVLRLEIEDEGVDMNAGQGPSIEFYVGETGGSNFGGAMAVVREEGPDADSAAAMVFHTAPDDAVAPGTERMRITSVGNVGIGTQTPSGSLHIKVGAGAGASTWSARDDIVIDSDDRAGITILTPGGSGDTAAYVMGSVGDNQEAAFELDSNSGHASVGTKTVGLVFYLRSGNGVATLTLDENQHVTASNNLVVTDAILVGPSAPFPELSAGVVSGSAGLSGSHAKINGVVSGGVFLGDGSGLTGLDAFPFSGAVAQMTGTLVITGSDASYRGALLTVKTDSISDVFVVSDTLLSSSLSSSALVHVGDKLQIGQTCVASGYLSTVAGGKQNEATQDYAAVVGGLDNTATNTYSFVGGGALNNSTATMAGIVAGYNSDATGDRSFIGGGNANTNAGSNSSIGGGDGNKVNASDAFIGAGTDNHNRGVYGFIGAGYQNVVSQNYAMVVGGQYNTASNYYAFVGGGASNVVSGRYSSIPSGELNTVSQNHANICGGKFNLASAHYTSILGGLYNTASAERAAVIGGSGSTVSGRGSIAVGSTLTVAENNRVVLGSSETDGDAYTLILSGTTHVHSVLSASAGLTGSAFATDGLITAGNISASVNVSASALWTAIYLSSSDGHLRLDSGHGNINLAHGGSTKTIINQATYAPDVQFDVTAGHIGFAPMAGGGKVSVTGSLSASAGITGSTFLTDGPVAASVLTASAGISGSHAKINGVVSGAVFLGDGSNLTGITADNFIQIFSEVSSTRACTTSSIGIGHTAGTSPQALLYLTASDALGHDNQPYFYIDSVNLSRPPMWVTASSYATSRMPLVGIGTKTPTYTLTVEGGISGSTIRSTTITGSTLMGGTYAGGLSLSGSRVMVTGSLLPVSVSASLNVSASSFYGAHLFLGRDGGSYPEVKSPDSALYLNGDGGIILRDDTVAYAQFKSGSTDGVQTFEIWSDMVSKPISFNATYFGGIQHTQLFLDMTNRISTFSGSVRIHDDNSSMAGLTVTGSTRLSGSFAGGYRRITTDYEVKDHLVYNYIIGVSGALNSQINIILPSASATDPGHILIIKDEFAPTRTEQYAITASVSSSTDLVDGESAYYIYGTMGAITLYSDGIDKWFVV